MDGPGGGARTRLNCEGTEQDTGEEEYLKLGSQTLNRDMIGREVRRVLLARPAPTKELQPWLHSPHQY